MTIYVLCKIEITNNFNLNFGTFTPFFSKFFFIIFILFFILEWQCFYELEKEAVYVN